jgi:PAS domain S-box-containing protein
LGIGPCGAEGLFVKLSVKFGGAVLLMLAAILGVTAALLIRHQRQSIQELLLQRTQTILSFGESCRDYARDTLAPAVREIHQGPMVFEAESATFVARGTLQAFTKRQPEYSFREASRNPLNLENQANDHEGRLIERFRSDSSLTEVSGFDNSTGRESFYVARPIIVRAACLNCHASPESAPPELVRRYGREHGYGWKEGEVNSAIIVSVPAGDVRAQQAAVTRQVLLCFGGGMLVLLGLIHFLSECFLLAPIRRTVKVMGAVAADPAGGARLPVDSSDELGVLAQTFNRMADGVRDSYALLTRRVADRTLAVTQSYAELADEMKRRQQAQEELSRSAELLGQTNSRLQAVLDAATLFAIIATDDKGTITLFNAGAERMLGYTAFEMIGRHTPVLIHLPEEVDRRGRELSAALGRTVSGFDVLVAKPLLDGSEEREWTYVRKDGSRLTVHLAVTPIRDGKGVVIGFLGVATDVTERRRAAEALRLAKNVAEAANRAKSEFLANMSHEIRTPMNGILGMTELTLGTDLTADQREYMEMVKNSADALLGVINDILDFSKIEAGKLDLDPIDFELRDAVADAIKTLGLRAHAKGLELTWHVAPDLPDFLVGDAGRVRQVLVNLVGNAVKFTERGEVALEVSRAEDGGTKTKGSEAVLGPPSSVLLHFEIRDTGIGIPAEKLAFIFDPFVQADTSTTRKYGGTGLGLAITARLVGMMGGRIWAESTPGLGSTFHFTARFPLQGRSPSKLLPPRPAGLENLRVLVVDDNATNRRVLRETLAGWLMRPTAVEDARAALVELERAADEGEPFPLLLLDACMPEMDGFMLAEEIRLQPALAGVVIMMLSSADRQGDNSRCRGLGIKLYLTKPVKQAELRDSLMTALREPLRTPPPRSPSRESLPEPAPMGKDLKILLAEDNVVNQKLAKRLLEKQGHRVTVVEDGAAAVRAVEQDTFDLVLMDVQMPRMSGLEAATLIRERERVTGRHLPIVAMTARAMKGDREECLASGMDGYVSKPIQPKHLFDAISAAVQASPAPLPPPAPNAPGASSPLVFDPDAMRQRLGDDDQLLRELVELFLGDYPSLLQRVAEAVRSADPEAVRQAAHTLKGSVSNFGARDATRLARQLEEIGRGRDLTAAEQTFAELEAALRQLREALDKWLGVSA